MIVYYIILQYVIFHELAGAQLPSCEAIFGEPMPEPVGPYCCAQFVVQDAQIRLCYYCCCCCYCCYYYYYY